MNNRRKSGRPAGDGMDIPKDILREIRNAQTYKNRWLMRKKNCMCLLWKTSAKTFLKWCFLQEQNIPNHHEFDLDIEKNCIKYGNEEYHPALCMLMHWKLNIDLEGMDKELSPLLTMPTKDPMKCASLVRNLEAFREKAKILCSKPDQMDEGIQERISLINRDFYSSKKEIQLSLPFLIGSQL